MKGTEINLLMWIYSDERMRRKRRYVKAGKQADDWNRKLYKPYRSERVMNRLLRLNSLKLVNFFN